MLLQYENELYSPDCTSDFDWDKAFILGSSTEVLTVTLRDYQNRLESLRLNEPPKKRKNVNSYRSWVHSSHDLLDMIHFIESELALRKSAS